MSLFDNHKPYAISNIFNIQPEDVLLVPTRQYILTAQAISATNMGHSKMEHP